MIGPFISISKASVWALAPFAGAAAGIALGAYAINELVCRALDGYQEYKTRQYEKAMTDKLQEFKKLHPGVTLRHEGPRNGTWRDYYNVSPREMRAFQCPISEEPPLFEEGKRCRNCETIPDEINVILCDWKTDTGVLHRLFERVQYIAIPLIGIAAACLTPYFLVPAGVPLAGKVLCAIVGGVVLGAIPALIAPLSRIGGCGGCDRD